MSPFPPPRFTPAALIALALGSLAGPALAQEASRPALAAQRIVIDAETGRARMPEHDEVVAPAATAARAAAPAAAARTAQHPLLERMQGQALATRSGTLARRVSAERLSFSVARVGADGRLDTQCVTGASAADVATSTGTKEAADAR